jgi:hypothetical protein
MILCQGRCLRGGGEFRKGHGDGVLVWIQGSSSEAAIQEKPTAKKRCQ